MNTETAHKGAIGAAEASRRTSDGRLTEADNLDLQAQWMEDHGRSEEAAELRASAAALRR